VIPYFDIPLQHISPKLLRAMKRLDPDIDVFDLIKRIRQRFSGSPNPACIRTTFIVGFPGETEDDFEVLMDFVNGAEVDRLTVFLYSAEEGSHAAGLPDEVLAHIAESRLHRLMEAQQDISLAKNEEWVGKEFDVLIEGESDEGRRAGRSYRDAPDIDGLVFVDNLPESAEDGDIVRVKVTGALPYDLETEWEDISDAGGAPALPGRNIE
jgi:ribosomal protein S12 methylthiotransferase